MTTSESHSQAIHVCPSLVNENGSVLGMLLCSNTQSPVRICQPVSESVSNHPTPFVHQNSATKGSRKARSVNEGRHRHATADMQTEPRRFGRALAELDLIISLLVSARLGTKAGNLLPNAVAPKPLRLVRDFRALVAGGPVVHPMAHGHLKLKCRNTSSKRV